MLYKIQGTSTRSEYIREVLVDALFVTLVLCGVIQKQISTPAFSGASALRKDSAESWSQHLIGTLPELWQGDCLNYLDVSSSVMVEDSPVVPKSSTVIPCSIWKSTKRASRESTFP